METWETSAIAKAHWTLLPGTLPLETVVPRGGGVLGVAASWGDGGDADVMPVLVSPSFLGLAFQFPISP